MTTIKKLLDELRQYPWDAYVATDSDGITIYPPTFATYHESDYRSRKTTDEAIGFISAAYDNMEDKRPTFYLEEANGKPIEDNF